MASYGSLLFYGKNGLSAPFSLSYGKTTIGTSANHHIRIKCDEEVSCILDTNEVGVTILVNENENKNILINSLLTKKYTVITDGDHLEVGKKKFKYTNPSLEKMHLEQTQKTIDKRLGSKENRSLFNPPTPLKRLQNVLQGSSKRRFSTGSKIREVKDLPVPNRKTSTPQSASKVRFSQRMLTRRSSMLASVKENEVFDFQSPIVNFNASPIPKKRTSSLTVAASPLMRKNKTFAGNLKFSSPVPAKNKTYSGNISDASETVTTPENNVTAASITPLNVSKKSKKSLSLDRSRTLPYLDFPGNSSTPKSAIKLNRSSSLYKPIVEDITPASPLPRSSLKNTSLKMAFTQRRSVNFNISSSTDTSVCQDLSVDEEKSLSSSKRKRNESIGEVLDSSKKRKSSSFIESDDEEQENSLHDSSLSGIHNLSDVSSTSNKNVSAKLSISNRSKKNISLKQESDPPSIISWRAEMSSTNLNLSDLPDTSSKSKISTRNSSRLNTDVDDKTGDLSEESFKVGASEQNKTDEDNSSDISLHLSSSNTCISDLDNTGNSKRSSRNVTNSKLDSVLDESFNSSIRDSEAPPRMRRSNVQARKSRMSKARSKSLNLERKINKSIGALSKTLDGNMMFSSFEDGSGSSKEPEESEESSVYDMDKIASTPLVPTKRKSSNQRNNSMRSLSNSTTRMSLNISPITPKASKPKRSRSTTSKGLQTPVEMGNSTNGLFASKLDASLPDFNDSTNQLFEFKNDASKEHSKMKNRPQGRSQSENNRSVTSTRTSLRNRSSITSKATSDSSKTSKNASFCDSLSADDVNESKTLEVLFKTPQASRKSATLNVSLMSENDPTDVKSMEKVLQKSLETSRRIKTRGSICTNESYSDLTDRESETSLNITSKSNVNSRNLSSRSSQSTKKTPKQQTTPKNDLTNISGVKYLLKTPKQIVPPKNDLSDVAGVRELLKTPKPQNSPKNDLTNITGVKKLLKTPKVQRSPQNDLTDIKGVKKLLKTPKVQKTPRNDLTNITGVKKLLKTPKVQKTPKNDLTNIEGIKKLLKTPKVPKSPRNDLTNIAGVKKLLQSPRVQKSPKNDLTDVRGVKKLMATRKAQKSPKNDLTNIAGVKKLMSTPKVQASPKNDLTKIVGLKKLMSSPNQPRTPKNDLTDINGVKKMFRTPKEQREPRNDLLDVRGIKQLLRTPKNKAADESHDLSGIDILFNDSQESNFDKLLDKKPPRTYGRSPKTNKSQIDEAKTPEHVLKWLEDQSKLDQTATEKEQSKSRKRASSNVFDTSDENFASSNKKQKTSKTTHNNLLNLTSELTACTSIIEKPASTPKVDNLKSSSKIEGSGIGKKTRRNKNAVHDSIESISSSKQATKIKDPEIEEKTIDHKIEDVKEEKKPTKRTRGKKETESNVSVEEEPVRNTRGKRAKVLKTDSQESVSDIKEETGRPRRGAAKESDKKPGPAKRTRNNKTKDDEEKIVNDEETEHAQKGRTRRKEVAEERSIEVHNSSGNNEKMDQEKSQEVQTTKPVRRGRNKKEQEKSQEEEVIKEPAKRGRKKIDKEKSQDEVETDKPVKRGRKEMEQDKSQKEEVINEPAKRGRRKMDQEKSHEELETDKPVKRGRNITRIKEDKKESPIKKSTRTRKVNTEVDQTKTQADKDESNDHTEETDDKRKPATKKSTRKTKKDNAEIKVEEETKITSTIENSEENQDTDSVPIRKNTRKAKKNPENETKEQTNKDENDEENDKENSPIKKTTRRTRKGKTDDSNNSIKSTQADKVEEKASPIKKTTRRTKKEIADTEQKAQKRTALAVKDQDENYNEAKDEEKETPIKKTTRRAKKIDVVDAEEVVQNTRTTRANKGKNKKYNEEEWDTPVKKDKKQAVTFKTDVDILQTPAKDTTPVGRSLRKRNLK